MWSSSEVNIEKKIYLAVMPDYCHQKIGQKLFADIWKKIYKNKGEQRTDITIRTKKFQKEERENGPSCINW